MLLNYGKYYVITINGEPKVVAPLMCNTIMRLATLDGNASITAVRTNLCELTQYKIKQKSNIDKIQTYFNQNTCSSSQKASQ